MTKKYFLFEKSIAAAIAYILDFFSQIIKVNINISNENYPLKNASKIRIFLFQLVIKATDPDHYF